MTLARERSQAAPKDGPATTTSPAAQNDSIQLTDDSSHWTLGPADLVRIGERPTTSSEPAYEQPDGTWLLQGRPCELRVLGRLAALAPIGGAE